MDDPSTLSLPSGATIGGPLQDVQPPSAPEAQPDTQPQPDNSTSTPDSLGGLYFHDPAAIEDPNQIGKYLTKVSFFGGKDDVKSGQDNGKYAYGGGSYDPKTGLNSTVPALALPPEWYDRGIVKPGQIINVYNPQDPQRQLPVVIADKGPAERTGRGADLFIPDDLKSHLGVKTDDDVGLDFTQVLKGQAPSIDQPPQPGTAQDYTMGKNIRAMMANQPASSMIAGDITADSIQQAMKSGPKGINPDGSIDFGNGVSYFKGSRIIQAEAGGTRYQWRPGEDKPHIVNVNPKSNIITDKNTGGMFDVSDINHPKAINLPGDPANVDLSGIKEGDWSSVPPELRNTAQMIANYKYPPLTGFALKSNYYQKMFEIIGKVDPSFDQKNYQSKQKLLTDYAGEGKNGQNILSINTAIDHLGDAAQRSKDLADALGNPSTSGMSYIKNKAASAFGYSEPGNYQAKVSALTNEMERATSGGAPHEGGKSAWDSVLSGSGTTHGQRLGAMDSMVGLLGKRLHEIQNQYERTMGKSDVSFLSPEAEQVLQGIAKTQGANSDATKVLSQFGSNGGKKQYIDPNSLSGQLPSAQGPKVNAVPTTVGSQTFQPGGTYYDNNSRQHFKYNGLNPDGTPNTDVIP